MLAREPFEQDFTNQGHTPWLRHAYAEAWHRSARVGPHAGRMPLYEGLTVVIQLRILSFIDMLWEHCNMQP